MPKCEHCGIDKDEIMPKEDAKRRLAAKDEKIADLTGEIKAKAALVEQAEGKAKAAEAKIAEYEPLRERVEAIERAEMLAKAGIPADKLTDGKLGKRIQREYASYVDDAKDSGAEPKPFSDWLAAEDGARADPLLAPLFAKAAEPIAEPAAPANGKPVAKPPPRPAANPPAAPPAQAPSPTVPRTAADVQSDPVYAGHYKAAEAARARGDRAGQAEALGKARERLQELQRAASQPVAT